MKKSLLLVMTLVIFQMVFGQKKVTVNWDASLSMQDREISRELNYLDNYFKKHPEVEIHLVSFSNDIILEEKFTVTGSNWEALRNELLKTVYDGATSYSKLFNQDSDEYLIFTDGVEILDKLEPPVSKPITIVSTVSVANPKFQRIAESSNGSYVLLNSSSDTTSAYSIDSGIMTGSIGVLVSGVITDEKGPLANVNVFNRDRNEGTTSSSDGSYRIKADIGDQLVFTFIGKKTINIIMPEGDFLNINMVTVTEALEGVVVTTEALEEEELVNTGNTMVDKKTLGYSIESIDEDDISQLDTDVQQAVKGQFAGLQIASDAGPDHQVDLSQFIGRGRNSTIALSQYGLIVIDGVPQQQSDSSAGGFRSTTAGHINPDIIHSITYLKGLAATNRYGSLGRNGVLLITTKNAILGTKQEKKEVKLGTTETYSANVGLVQSLPSTPYIKALKGAGNVEEAFNIYLDQRTEFLANPEFYIDSYDYFQGWNNPYLSDRILTNIYEKFFDSPEVLRSLAYKQIEGNKFNEALFTYQRILKLKPNQAQSYLDVARAHTLAGNYHKALKMYDRIDKMRNVGRANFSGIEKTVTNDFKNLVNKHKGQLNTAGVNPKFMTSVKHRTRIIFEWNNPDSEFDLQIVNPQKRFFTWEHSKAKAAQRIAEEKQQGWGLEEFYLTSSDIGEWLFNIKYLGTNTGNDIPSYLKITIYNNFGQANETMETKVIRLSEKGKLQTAVKLKV
ncbi:MAG: TonB-dependent receptor plug domain-containing protein [Flavobacteriaceae bacterium]|nr:TonB-dependent receptor plug domain-containing protein [Flavobacteriaceae bacterium]